MAQADWTKIETYPVTKNSEVRLYVKAAGGGGEIYNAELIVNGRCAMELPVDSRRRFAMEDCERHVQVAKKMFDAAKREIDDMLRRAL